MDVAVANNRVRAFALWEGWFGCDRNKYADMLREVFQPFELLIAESPPQLDSREIRAAENWANTPFFSGIPISGRGEN